LPFSCLICIDNNAFWTIVVSNGARCSRIDNVEKMMPMEFISEDGFGITAQCREYLQPLIEGENYPPYKNGLPDYVVLKKEMVAKKLPDFEYKK
jgi:hypothetical protein